jgi:methionine biosynthesis protein MetW
MRGEAAVKHSSPDRHSHGFVAGTVDPLRYEYDDQAHDPDEIIGILSRLIPPGSRVLDVGCGTGSVSVQVIADGRASLVGVEPDETRANAARERGVDARTGFLTPELIRELGAFDVVLFADVLEHLADPLSLLELARTALGPGGRVIASVPNIAHWSVRTELARGKFVYRDWGIMDATHLRWFTDANLRLLFQSAGLAIEDRRVTAGIDLQCYSERWPWRVMSRATRMALVRRALKQFPLLFGCQLIVRSAPVGGAAQR